LKFIISDVIIVSQQENSLKYALSSYFEPTLLLREFNI